MQPAPFWDALAHSTYGLSLSPPDRAAVSVCVANAASAALFAPLPGVCACVCDFSGVGVPALLERGGWLRGTSVVALAHAHPGHRGRQRVAHVLRACDPRAAPHLSALAFSHL
jgi:hypothetical protein